LPNGCAPRNKCLAPLPSFAWGATLYPSFAQDDHRPAWPFDAADLLVQGRIHELTELHPLQLLQLVSIVHPTGGPPAWAEAYLLCRRP
jgi:hypothetical protein